MPELDAHFEEYKLVQDKIDKIGNFRFVIRGWAVTLVSTFIGATALADLHPANNLVLLLAIVLFAAVEQSQTITKSGLTLRAFQLERELSKPPTAPPPGGAPTPLRGKAFQIGAVIARATGTHRRTVWGTIAEWTNGHFYIALAVIVGVSIALRLLLPGEKPKPITITTSGPTLRISAEPAPSPAPAPMRKKVEVKR